MIGKNSTPSEGGVFANNDIDMPPWFTRSYTGHEHLREFDLINMNGRLYDPIPGRMLSADNFVQAPGSSQSYNRYSYAFNNPLKYTDPSGEFNVWAALGAAAAAAGISYLGNVVNNNFEWNPNNWSSGSVTVGLASNGSTIDLFGGGSIAGNSFIAGRNISTGIWGGGSSSFGQASYSQMPSYSLGKINMGIVNSYMPQNRPAGLPDYNRGAQTAKQFVADFKLGWKLGWHDDSYDLAYGGGGGGPGDGGSGKSLFGVSVEFEISFPKWVTNHVTGGTTGWGLEIGLIDFDNGMAPFYTTKHTEDANTASFAIDAGPFLVIPNFDTNGKLYTIQGNGVERGINVPSPWVLGPGYSQGQPVAPSGGVPSYTMHRLSVGAGFELGIPLWQTNTTYLRHSRFPFR